MNTPIDMDSAELHFIGHVSTSCEDKHKVPKYFTESERRGILEIFPQYREALHTLEAGQTIVALFWLHESQRETLQVYPRGDISRGLHGVFATRSPNRPNPIGLSELYIERIDGLQIHVNHLDVINNTPLIDIKKKIPGL